MPNQLMEFICMDLIGEFHPPTSRGHKYALTVMDMLTGFVFCAPLQTKKAKEIVQKYFDTVYIDSVDPGRFCQTMAQNLKTGCLKR